MDRDCHYYMTYLAAREAEFAHPEAHQIAAAAQYIDDCHESLVYYWSKAKALVPFATHLKHRVVDVQDNGETFHQFHPILTGMFDMAVWAGTSGAEGNRQVWVPFHFLPGNFSMTTKSRPSCDMHVLRAWQDKPLDEWPKEAQTYLPFLCRPNSPLSTDVVRSMVDNYSSINGKAKNVALHHLGVVMHVLGDTFAHQDFAGTPLQSLNDVAGGDTQTQFTTKGVWKNDRWLIDETSWQSIDWYCGARGIVNGNDPICIYPPRGTDNSYLGHGMAGHLPDTGCIAFKLKRPWSTDLVVRNNPETYLHAFMNMVTALRCAQSGSTYQPLDAAGIKLFFRQNFAACKLVRDALIPDDTLRNQLYSKKLRVNGYFPKMETRWQTAIKTRHDDVEEISGYEMLRDKWNSEFLAMAAAGKVPIETIRNDGFFSFSCAAKLHYRFVYNALQGSYSGVNFQRAAKFEKYYDPHLAMLDDVVAVFSGAGAPSLQAWVVGAYSYFKRAMEAAEKPNEILGLEFVKDAVINAAGVTAALNGLTEWIANEHSDDEMLYPLFGNGSIKKELEDLHYFLTKEVAQPSSPVTRARSNAITQAPFLARRGAMVGVKGGRPRRNAIVKAPELDGGHFKARRGKVD